MPLELIAKREGRVLKVLQDISNHVDKIARNTDVRDGLKTVSKRLEEIRAQLDESLYCLCDDKCDEPPQDNLCDEKTTLLIELILSAKEDWAAALHGAGVRTLEDLAGSPASQSSAKKHARHLVRKMKERLADSQPHPGMTEMTLVVKCARDRLSRTSST